MEVKLKILFLILLIHSTALLAVTVSPDERGEVLIIPYYTVNNGLNTLVTVTNDNDQAKAVKITFREGTHGQAVFAYNVYLDARDVWAFGLVPLNSSSIPGQSGNPHLMHLTVDQSCVPFLIKSGQEFWPIEVGGDTLAVTGNREGFIEIIEMGVLDEPVSTWADTTGSGVPISCVFIQSAWAETDESGFWNPEQGGDLQQHILPPAGGLTAEAFLIDVDSGRNYAYQATALTDFFAPGASHHTPPADDSLSLDAAGQTNSWIETETGPQSINADTGLLAVKTALIRAQALATYDLSVVANGQSEVITTFPLQRFGSDPGGADCAADDSAITWQMYDREGRLLSQSTAPEPLCQSVLVTTFVPAGQTLPDTSFITGTERMLTVQPPAGDGEPAGHLLMNFSGAQEVTVVEQGEPVSRQLLGVPVIGMVLQNYTNAAAQEGLLAQYASSHPLVVQTQLISSDQSEASVSQETP
jgi:hypothetical protein